MKAGIFEISNGKLVIGGKFAYYMYATHGIPKEYLKDIINIWLDNDDNKYKLWRAMHYETTN